MPGAACLAKALKRPDVAAIGAGVKSRRRAADVDEIRFVHELGGGDGAADRRV